MIAIRLSLENVLEVFRTFHSEPLITQNHIQLSWSIVLISPYIYICVQCSLHPG